MGQRGGRQVNGAGRVRRRIAGEHGFTLIELLVVIIIIGLLAAIALPAFLGQEAKAADAGAKELAHTAQVAAEAYATDHDGSWTGLDVAALAAIEGTIPTAPAGGAYLSSVTNADASGYTLTVSDARSNETFSISHRNGSVTRTCSPTTGVAGGCVSGSW